MVRLAALLSGLAVFAQGAGIQSPIVLACSIPAAAAPGAPTSAAASERVFRIAPGSFQEWNAIQQQFGGNLCAAYTCVKRPDRAEGSIGSASVIYTVGIVHQTGEAYWRAVGASGLSMDHGPCRVIAEPKPRWP